MQAEITLEYDNKKTARAIANAISPDNYKAPGNMTIKTTNKARKVTTTIRFHGKLPTFIATIDDLLSSATTAEKTLLTTRRLQKQITQKP